MRNFSAFVVSATVVLAVTACGKGGASGSSTSGTASGGAGMGTASTATSMTGMGGSGTSTAAQFMTNSVTTGSGCAGQITCAQKGYNCGKVGDGCGGVLDCGPITCTKPGDTCGGNNMPNVCGQPACTPKTCQDLGFDCGMASDQCNGTVNCGVCSGGQTCGGGNAGPNKCGNGVCTPLTFALACTMHGFTCGKVSDGCTGLIDCSQGIACPTGTSCGGNQAKPNTCGAPPCMSKTCAQQGFNCGMATDGCNNVIDCGPVSNCVSPQVCGGTGPNVCGTPNCTGLCLQQQPCATPGVTTTVTGTVYAPNGTDPVYNTLVYIPNGAPGPDYGVTAISPGVHCGACGDDVSGSPLVSAVTDVHGNFTLTNVPVGVDVPIVIQNGRWRRKMLIPKASITACQANPLPSTGAAQLRFPRIEGETDVADNVPQMAFVTGDVDALECVLRKIGLSDMAFSDPAPAGTGRVQLYVGNGGPGATHSATTPPEDLLWGTQARINQYDMVFFACQGQEYDKPFTNRQIVENYANSGGRIFNTHFSYVWIAPTTNLTASQLSQLTFPGSAVWDSPIDQPPNFTTDPQTGFIDTNFPKGLALAQWLQGINATTTQGQISIHTLRNNFSAVNNPPSTDWIYLTDPKYPGSGTPASPAPKPMHYTFNTPVGVAPSQQCGKVLYDDFHVEDQLVNGASCSLTANPPVPCPAGQDCVGGTCLPQFPVECTSPTMTPQEKMLEFMIFDLGSCVTPPVCAPKSCTALGAQCGPIGDGCGNIEQCGNCPTGQFCVNNQCQGCTAKTCLQQNFVCGQQGDTCGGTLNCGMCPQGQSCVNGQCMPGICTPKACGAPPAGVGTCGAQGDGCGNIVMCGGCGPNMTCTNGTCTPVNCIPKTCAQQGFNCGQASDGCNGILQCGTCTQGQTCGGGTPPMANVCGGGAA